MTKSTKSAKKTKKFRYWPKPKEGQPYGPTEFQKLAFIDEMPWELRGKLAHYHDTDILLYLGGTRSGKTKACVVRCVKAARTFHNAKIFVGGLEYKHLWKSTIKDFQQIFTERLPWDHPSVIKYPNANGTQNELIIKTADGQGISTITFMGLQEPERVLGSEADLWYFDEPERLKDQTALEFAITRLSSSAVPWKQILLSANPVANLAWLIEWFRLEQYEAGYDGPPLPIGMPCACHLCGACEEQKITVMFVDGLCPHCGKKKTTKCPGGQHYKRVVISDSSMNPHLPDQYRRDLLTSLGEDRRVALGSGLIFSRKRGKLYTGYDKKKNVYEFDKEIDWDKPIIWTHDINRMPMMSVICQEFIEDHVVHVDALDEIVKRNADAATVAEEFIDRYSHLYRGSLIKIYGDPSGFNGHVRGKELDRYNTIAEILKNSNFNVEVKAYPTRFSRNKRYDSVNSMLRGLNPVTLEELVRLHINPKMKWLIKSLEETKWDITGKHEDETEDKKYRDKGREGELAALTHISAALGYYITQEHPVIPQQAAEAFAVLSTMDRLVQLNESDKISSAVRDMKKKEPSKMDEYELERELEIERQIAADLEWQPQEYTPADMLRERGLWRL